MLGFPTMQISPPPSNRNIVNERICIQHCACLAFVRLALHISTLTFTLAFRFLTCDIDFQAERVWAGWACSASAFQISSESFDSIAVGLSFYFVLENNEVIFGPSAIRYSDVKPTNFLCFTEEWHIQTLCSIVKNKPREKSTIYHIENNIKVYNQNITIKNTDASTHKNPCYQTLHNKTPEDRKFRQQRTYTITKYGLTTGLGFCE